MEFATPASKSCDDVTGLYRSSIELSWCKRLEAIERNKKIDKFSNETMLMVVGRKNYWPAVANKLLAATVVNRKKNSLDKLPV